MTARKSGARKRRKADPLEEFGPGVADEPEPPAGPASDRPFGAIPCAGEGCFLKPFADLVSKFALRVVRGHGPSLGRAAGSGIELMKALRDFLDEEIALSEQAAARGEGPRVRKIPVE